MTLLSKARQIVQPTRENMGLTLTLFVLLLTVSMFIPYSYTYSTTSHSQTAVNVTVGAPLPIVTAEQTTVFSRQGSTIGDTVTKTRPILLGANIFLLYGLSSLLVAGYRRWQHE